MSSTSEGASTVTATAMATSAKGTTAVAASTK